MLRKKEDVSMALVPYDPFRQLSNMRKDFERFFSDFPSTLGTETNFGEIRVDVHETENEVVVTCDIPGLQSKEDVNVTVENNTLSISGSTTEQMKSKRKICIEKNVFRPFSSFCASSKFCL